MEKEISMFLIQYYMIIFYSRLTQKWRKRLKTKRLREEQDKLRLVLEKLQRRKRENEALKGDLSHDLPRGLPDPQPAIDRQPQVNLESGAGH